MAARGLPPNPYSASSQPSWHDAYNHCLRILPRAPADGIDVRNKELVYPRILGFLLLEAPSPQSRDYVSQEILSCKGSKLKLFKFAELFMLTILPLFRNNCSSSEIEGDPAQIYAIEAQKTPQDHRSAKLSALHRDSHRCMVTQYYDNVSYQYFLTPEAKAVQDSKDFWPIRTDAWHSIPPLSGLDCDSSRSALTFFQCYCSISPEELTDSAHKLTNVLTLAIHVRCFLSDFHVWFEAIPDKKDTYRVCSWLPYYLHNLPTQFTFSTETNLALPDPQYLKVFEVICRVARWSGAAERAYLLQEEEEMNNETG